jgi:transcriptional regulator with XRE-family HTH domain
MSALYPNLYQRGRKTTLLTQEEAAERLGISPETLKRYEGGRLTPPDETVARMCEVYGVSWLALEHAKATDRLGILPELEPKPLPMATISLTNRLRDAADRLAGLLRIAEDGVIDDAERPEFDIIVQDLRETIAAAYQVIYADAKKERPEAATSKRSRSQRNSENHCKAILPQKKRNVKALREEARA